MECDSIVWLQYPEKGCRSLEGVLVPMCQSPRIADVLLRAQKIPANDNHAPAEKTIGAAPAGLLMATCQTILIICCAVAFLL